MDKIYFRQLYDYTAWANRLVWDCVLHLSEAAFRQELDYSIGSIFTQCVHTMGVEYWWLHFIRTGEYSFINPDDYNTREQIRAKWDEIEVANFSYIDSLTPTELQRMVKPEFWDEPERPIAVWEALTQVAFHSMDHRAQTLAGLHRLGAPTVGQDFLDYIHSAEYKNPYA